MNATSYRISRAVLLIISAALLSASTLIAAGCGNEGGRATSSATLDSATQSAMTPDQALSRLREGNQRFVAGASFRRDYRAQVKATADGQHPFAVIVSCIDSRSGP